MERDLDLIRLMLLKAAEHPSAYVHDVVIEGYPEAVVGYHAHLLGQAGLADVMSVTSLSSHLGPVARMKTLTWAGHDYIDAIRDDGVWKRTKETTAKAGVFTLDFVKQVAIAIAKEAIVKGGLSM